MRAIRKVTSGELLTKHEIRKKIIIYKKDLCYFSKIVTAGIKALVVLGNKFLYAYVQEVCRL
jgi:hypothetical protein